MTKLQNVANKRFLLLILITGVLGFISFVIIFGFFLNPIMERLLDSELYPTFATLITLIFTAILVLRTNNKGISFSQLRFIILFSSFMVVFNFLQIFEWDIALSNTPFNRPIGYPILNLADQFICFAVFILYIHFETLISYFPNLKRLLIVSLVIFPVLILNFILIFYQKEWINRTVGLLSLFLAIGVIFIVVFMIYTVGRIYTIHSDRRTRKGAIIMGASILNLGIAFASQPLIPDDIDFIIFQANIYQLMLFAIAVSLLGIAYIMDPYLIYSNPFRIHDLIIYDAAGILVYHVDYTEKDDSEVDSVLKSASLSSINVLMQEISGFRGSLSKISLGDGKLVFAHNSKVTVCIIAEFNSYSLQAALNRFTNELNTKMQSIPMDRGKVKLIIDPLKSRYFPA